METTKLAILLGIVNAVLSLIIAGTVYSEWGPSGPYFTIFYAVAAIILLFGVWEVKIGKLHTAWILLMAVGIVTLPVGLLGVFAALKIRNLRGV